MQSQRPAHLVFWYESEVQNGGHFQYFTNRSDHHIEETIQSLNALGAHDHACSRKLLPYGDRPNVAR
jgi:hypothetical protein